MSEHAQDPRLQTDRNVWMATVRPDGRPHLIPIWFVWLDDRFYICTGKESVKGRNLQANPQVVLSLEDGSKPLIAEGTATFHEPPYSQTLIEAFQTKYDWDMSHSVQYNVVVEVTVTKWLGW